MRNRGSVAIGIVTTFGCTALVASAVGGGGGEYGGFATSSKTVTMDQQAEAKTAAAKCPGDRTPVSAGFRSTLDVEGGPIVSRSLVTRSGSKARASVYLPAPATHRLTGYAHCANRAPDLSKRSRSRRVDPGEPGATTARCPRAKRLVGGGFGTKYHPDLDNFTGNLTIASYPVDRRTWRVRAVGVTGEANSPTRLKATAYCADVSGVTIASKVVSGAKSDHPKAVARCPESKVAISGGFKSSTAAASPPFEGFLRSLVPSESRRTGARAWSAVGSASKFGGPPRWTAYALCAKR